MVIFLLSGQIFRVLLIDSFGLFNSSWGKFTPLRLLGSLFVVKVFPCDRPGAAERVEEIVCPQRHAALRWAAAPDAHRVRGVVDLKVTMFLRRYLAAACRPDPVEVARANDFMNVAYE